MCVKEFIYVRNTHFRPMNGNDKTSNRRGVKCPFEDNNEVPAWALLPAILVMCHSPEWERMLHYKYWAARLVAKKILFSPSFRAKRDNLWSFSFNSYRRSFLKKTGNESSLVYELFEAAVLAECHNEFELFEALELLRILYFLRLRRKLQNISFN